MNQKDILFKSPSFPFPRHPTFPRHCCVYLAGKKLWWLPEIYSLPLQGTCPPEKDKELALTSLSGSPGKQTY